MSRDVTMTQYLASVAEVLTAIGRPGLPLPPEAFVAAYFGQDVVGVDDVAPLAHAPHLARAHLALGLLRRPGEDLIGMATPQEETDGWSAGGSTVIQVVTDDRPFIVDTVIMDLTELGWTIRTVRHPILAVERDAGGTLTAVGPQSDPGD